LQLSCRGIRCWCICLRKACR